MPPGSVDRERARNGQLKTELQEQRDGYAEDRAALQSELAAAEDSNAALDSELAELRAAQRLLQEEVVAAEAELAAAEETLVKVRQETAVGRTFDQVVTAGGAVYADVEVTRVAPAGISVRHSEGIVRIPLAELGSELTDELGIDPTMVEAGASAEGEAADATPGVSRRPPVVRRPAGQGVRQSQASAQKALDEQYDRQLASIDRRLGSLRERIRYNEDEIRRYADLHARARIRGRTSGWTVFISKLERENSKIRGEISRLNAAAQKIRYGRDVGD